MKRFELDNYKEQIIKLYTSDKFSCEKVAHILNASLSGIYDALKRWGIKSRNLSQSHRVYSIDENYFEEIDTEEKAYWLGFIYADGFITSPHAFGVALALKDKQHLDKLKKALKSEHPLHELETNSSYGRNSYVRLLVHSEAIYNQLMSNGVMLNKSLILEFPTDKIPDKNLYNHFIRGYFDGDGSLVLSKNSINFKICGTKEFLSRLFDIFNSVSIYDFKYNLYKRKKDDKNNYYISYGGKQKTYSILNFLYGNSTVYLDRKKEKYNLLKQLYDN
ncbi:MAG: hypothetical protein K0R09_2259 [Clostridiales bacterium]|jgi:hypothetical protein|nr:hypothetical protein [Clostridiales bacterium]